MSKMINLGTAWVFACDIVAIEKGAWSDHHQDWKAIVVASGGARISTDLFTKTVKAILEDRRMERKEL